MGAPGGEVEARDGVGGKMHGHWAPMLSAIYLTRTLLLYLPDYLRKISLLRLGIGILYLVKIQAQSSMQEEIKQWGKIWCILSSEIHQELCFLHFKYRTDFYIINLNSSLAI